MLQIIKSQAAVTPLSFTGVGSDLDGFFVIFVEENICSVRANKDLSNYSVIHVVGLQFGLVLLC